MTHPSYRCFHCQTVVPAGESHNCVKVDCKFLAYIGSVLVVSKPLSRKTSYTQHPTKMGAYQALAKARAYGKRNRASYQPAYLIHYYGKRD